jgi:hypothetical protein
MIHFCGRFCTWFRRTNESGRVAMVSLQARPRRKQSQKRSKIKIDRGQVKEGCHECKPGGDEVDRFSAKRVDPEKDCDCEWKMPVRWCKTSENQKKQGAVYEMQGHIKEMKRPGRELLLIRIKGQMILEVIGEVNKGPKRIEGHGPYRTRVMNMRVVNNGNQIVIHEGRGYAGPV